VPKNHPNAEIVSTWRRRIEAGWGTGTHTHTLSTLENLALDLLEGATEPEIVLDEISRRCATDGHALADVVGWLTILVDLAPRGIRRRLQRRSCAEAIARGWSHGALDVRPADRSVAPVAMLRLRLGELDSQCRALGVDLDHHYTLVVLDADTGALGADARELVMREVADAALARFTFGETVVATDSGRVIVLAERDGDLPGAVRALVAEVQDRPHLLGHRACGWIEPLPRDAMHHDALVDELAR
jgi:GGDEF-like domain